MPRLLQQLLAPLDPIAQDAHDPAGRPVPEEDLALGCESANPALQFEAWEPSLLVQAQGAAPAY